MKKKKVEIPKYFIKYDKLFVDFDVVLEILNYFKKKYGWE